MKKIVFTILFFAVLISLEAQTGLTITSGTHLRVSDGAELVLFQMDFENNGDFSHGNNSTLVFTGSTTKGIYTNSALSFYNLELNKPITTKVLLHNDISVENNLNLIQGRLDLNNFVIDLDGGQILNETALNYITGTNGGYIEYTATLNNPDQLNPGNLGIEITSVENLGLTTIRRGHEEQTSNGVGKSILRYYDVTPTNNSGLNATFRIYYHHAEFNGIPENELEPWRSTDGGNTWELQEGSLLNTTNNWVQLSGVDAFSRWTLASETTEGLPVELSSFDGKPMAFFNLLEWETVSEDNAGFFDIQKLKDQNWETIGRVEAAGFSDVLKQYSFQDADFENLEYYRLQMVDIDGKTEFSEVIAIQRNDINADMFNAYPNPVHDYLSLESEGNETVDELWIFDSTGKQIRYWESLIGEVDLSDLAPGLYYLEARYGQQFFMEKITKQ